MSFICDLCAATFSQKTNLYRHKRRQHKEEMENGKFFACYRFKNKNSDNLKKHFYNVIIFAMVNLEIDFHDPHRTMCERNKSSF